jgi:DNA-binding MarR family transcriptional regulator
MNDQSRLLIEFMRNIRTSFNFMKSTADELHADLQITASMRAVMETLFETDQQTVPDIARAKKVSRQHIQMIVNKLEKKKLIEYQPNPNDRRTSFVSLSTFGRTIAGKILDRETHIIKELSGAFNEYEMETANQVLRKFLTVLEEHKRKGK